ncbi:peptidylprolyl isomerase [Candidatus Omnitrophota bacterium]
MSKFFILFLALCVSLTAGCAKKPKDGVVATVNSKPITMAMVDERIDKLPKYYQSFASQHKKEVVDEIVIEELLYAEAKRRKLHKDPDVKQLIDDTVRKIIVSKIVEDETKKSAPVSDDDVKVYFQDNKDKYMVQEMVRASHILTSTEDEARKAQEELNQGVDFAEVAKKYSKDLTRERGGDLGFFKKDQMIPEFEKVCFALGIGETSDIVKTRFGYHIIKLTDRKPSSYRDFKDVKEGIRSSLDRERQRDKLEEFANGLKKKAKIKVYDKYLTQEPAPGLEGIIPGETEDTAPAKETVK